MTRKRIGVRGVFVAGLAGVLCLASTAGAASMVHTGSRVDVGSSVSASVAKALGAQLRRYDLFELDPGRVARSLPRKPAGASLRLRLGESIDWRLSLEPADPRSDRYVLRRITSRGIVSHPRTPTVTYRGVDRDGGGAVRLCIDDSMIVGFVEDGGTRVYLESARNLAPEARLSLLVVYEAGDVIPRERSDLHDFGGKAPPPPASTFVPEAPLAKGRAAFADQPCRIAEVAMAATFDMVEAYGSAENVETRIVSILNMVNELYADPRIGIVHEIVEMVIDETGGETYGRSSNFDLGGFLDWAGSSAGFTGDWDLAGCYFYLRGGGTIGIARVGAVCRGGGHIIRDYTSSAHGMMIDHAHELAHNWSAGHLDNSDCIMYPRVTGSNNQWCDATIAAIVNHKESRTCLESCDQPPQADFVVSDSNTCRGTVRFTDETRHRPLTWQWDFGDGTTSTERHPIHSYTTNGTYTVTLSVTNDLGSDTRVKQDYVTVQAPSAPSPGSPSCQGADVVVTASGDQTIKWYTALMGGAPAHVGDRLAVPLPAEATTYYVENGPPEAPVHTVGPVDTAQGDGGYKEDPGNLYMQFTALDDLRFRSITVYSNKAGKRHFILTTDFLRTSVNELITDIPVGESEVVFNWELQKGRTYELVLENTAGSSDTVDAPEVYYNNLYRSRVGVEYPQTVGGLVSVISNYWLRNNPGTTGWYIGYDWKVQALPDCGSARLPVEIGPNTCDATRVCESRPGPWIGRAARGAGWIVRFSAPVGSPYDIVLRDLAGRQVHRIRGRVPVGGTVRMAADRPLPSAAYLVHVANGGKELRRRVVHIR